MIIIKIALYLFAFCIIYHLITRKYLNPYKLTMVFGKKGAGKSTLLVKLALRYNKKGWTVYSTTRIPGTYYLPDNYVGKVEMRPNSVLLVDEVGMIWDNRDFKNFSKEVRDWFKLQRHRRVRVYLFSQSFDVDKKIRDLVDDMYLLTRRFRVFSYAKKINRSIIITKATAESASTLADNLQYDSFIFFLFGSRKITYIPRYVKYFDSFDAIKLKDFNYEYVPYLDDNKIKYKRRLNICSIMSRVYKKLVIKIKTISR